MVNSINDLNPSIQITDNTIQNTGKTKSHGLDSTNLSAATETELLRLVTALHQKTETTLTALKNINPGDYKNLNSNTLESAKNVLHSAAQEVVSLKNSITHLPTSQQKDQILNELDRRYIVAYNLLLKLGAGVEPKIPTLNAIESDTFHLLDISGSLAEQIHAAFPRNETQILNNIDARTSELISQRPSSLPNPEAALISLNHTLQIAASIKKEAIHSPALHENLTKLINSIKATQSSFKGKANAAFHNYVSITLQDAEELKRNLST